MKAKKNKPIIDAPKDAKMFIPSNHYFSWREKPISKAFLTNLAEKLLDWARTTPDAIDMDEFFEQNCIWYKQAHNWAQAHDFFKDAMQEALRIIGTRRHKNAFFGNANSSIFLLNQHNFKPEWHDNVNKYHSDLKREEEASKKQPINLFVNDVPTSDLVKAALEKKNGSRNKTR